MVVSVLVGLVSLDEEDELEEDSVDGRGSLLASVGVSAIVSKGSRSRGTMPGRRGIACLRRFVPWRAWC